MHVIRAVFDTNVFVAAGFRRSSASARLVELVRAGSIHLVWNAATRSETRRVLQRIPMLSWAAVGGLYRDEGEFPGPAPPSEFGQVRDPADRKFAALAAAAGVPLVSSDHDLLEHKGTGAFDVRTPGEMIAMATRRTHFDATED